MINLEEVFDGLGVVSVNKLSNNQKEFYQDVLWNDGIITHNQKEFFEKASDSRYDFFKQYGNEREFYWNIDDVEIWDFNTFYKHAQTYLCDLDSIKVGFAYPVQKFPYIWYKNNAFDVYKGDTFQFTDNAIALNGANAYIEFDVTATGFINIEYDLVTTDTQAMLIAGDGTHNQWQGIFANSNSKDLGYRGADIFVDDFQAVVGVTTRGDMHTLISDGQKHKIKLENVDLAYYSGKLSIINRGDYFVDGTISNIKITGAMTADFNLAEGFGDISYARENKDITARLVNASWVGQDYNFPNFDIGYSTCVNFDGVDDIATFDEIDVVDEFNFEANIFFEKLTSHIVSDSTGLSRIFVDGAGRFSFTLDNGTAGTGTYTAVIGAVGLFKFRIFLDGVVKMEVHKDGVLIDTVTSTATALSFKANTIAGIRGTTTSIGLFGGTMYGVTIDELFYPFNEAGGFECKSTANLSPITLLNSSQFWSTKLPFKIARYKNGVNYIPTSEVPSVWYSQGSGNPTYIGNDEFQYTNGKGNIYFTDSNSNAHLTVGDTTGRTFTFSLYAKLVSGTNSDHTLRASLEGGTLLQQNVVALTDEYQRFTLTVFFTGNTTGRVSIAFRQNVDATAVIAIKDVQFEAVSGAIANTYTLSCFAKKGTGDWLLLRPSDNNNFGDASNVWFNLATGTIGTTTEDGVVFTNTVGNIGDMGDGLYRCSVTFTTTATMVLSPRYFIIDNDANRNVTIGTNVLVGGCQLENGTLTEYQKTESIASYGTEYYTGDVCNSGGCIQYGSADDYESVTTISVGNKALSTDVTNEMLGAFPNLNTLDISYNLIDVLDISSNQFLTNVKINDNLLDEFVNSDAIVVLDNNDLQNGYLNGTIEGNGQFTAAAQESIIDLLGNGWTIEGYDFASRTLVNGNTYNVEDYPFIWLDKTYWDVAGNKGNTFISTSDWDFIPTQEQNESITSISLLAKSLSTDLTSTLLGQYIYLEVIDIRWNFGISVLDISANSRVKRVLCSSNPISSINLSNNPLLEEFIALDCDFSTVDFSNNPLLDDVNIAGTNVGSVDFSNNPLLQKVNLGGLTLFVLDFSNNPLLTTIFLSSGVNDVDLSHNPLLTYLYASNTTISVFDFRNNPLLNRCSVNNNQLASLDFSSTPNISLAYCQGNLITGESNSQIMIDLDNNGVTNGRLRYSNFTGTLTAAGEAAKANLLSKGWTITDYT